MMCRVQENPDLFDYFSLLVKCSAEWNGEVPPRSRCSKWLLFTRVISSFKVPVDSLHISFLISTRSELLDHTTTLSLIRD